MKYEIASELGLAPQIKNGYWGEVSSRACGAVGGRIGGKIGGNMVRMMCPRIFRIYPPLADLRKAERG